MRGQPAFLAWYGPARPEATLHDGAQLVGERLGTAALAGHGVLRRAL